MDSRKNNCVSVSVESQINGVLFDIRITAENSDWRKYANSIGISRTEQERMTPAFRF